MEEKLTRLYFRDNKERILQIMRHLNPKYLRGLWKKVRDRQYIIASNEKCIGEYYNEEEWRKTYTRPIVAVKYDGCIFYASTKTIRDEIKRRKLTSESPK